MCLLVIHISSLMKFLFNSFTGFLLFIYIYSLYIFIIISFICSLPVFLMKSFDEEKFQFPRVAVTNYHNLTIWGLKTMEIYSLTALKARRNHDVSKAPSEESFLASSYLLVAPSNPRCSLVCTCIIPISASIFTWCFSFCVCVCVSVSPCVTWPFYKDISHWI